MDIRLRLVALALVFAGTAAAAPPQATAEFSEWSGPQIRFDQPMLTWSGQTTLQGIHIEPELDCAWNWSGADLLSCERPPDAAALAPATPFTIRLDGGLWSQAGEELAPVSLATHSELPQVYAEGVEWRDGAALFPLRTPAGVAAADLRAVLVLESAGRELPLQVELLAQDQQRRGWQWAESRWQVYGAADYAGELALRVRPGLRIAGRPLPGTQDEVLARAVQHEPYRLRRWFCGHEGKPCAGGDDLILEFSREPAAAPLQRWLAQLPAGMKYERSDEAGSGVFRPRDHNSPFPPGWQLALRLERANTTFRLGMPAWLSAADGSALQAPAEITPRSGDFPRQLELPRAYLLQRPGDTAPLLGSARNTSARRIVERQLDATGLRRVEGTLPARDDNRSWPLRPMQAPARLRRNGGLVLGEFLQEYNEPARAYAIAYAPFHIAALRTPRQLLLWASDWKDFAPRAAVEMEVLQAGASGELRVLAQGSSGADGTVLLTLPAEKPPLFVRARSGNQISMMPLGKSPQAYGDASAEAGLLFWGVSDRPLYRPGDTVNFRVWLRERVANHLRPAPPQDALALHLSRSYDSDTVLQELHPQAQSGGSFSGTATLPAQLADGRYCIGPSLEVEGELCFDVENYHASALWAELKTAQRLVYDKESLRVTAQAGFHSGGPAADARAELQTLLTPLRLQDEFAEFAQFEFIDPFRDTHGSSGETLASEKTQAVWLDQAGRHEYVLPLDSAQDVDAQITPIPFGRLELSLAVSTSSSSYTDSGTIDLRFSRHRRFVGLRLGSGLSLTEDPELAAVVIDADGKRVKEAPLVTLTIEKTPPADSSGRQTQDKPAVLARCELLPDQPQRCPFRAPAAGSYRFTASSAGAAAATLTRYIGGAGAVQQERPTTELLRSGDSPGGAQILLRQPFARARVLFAVQHGVILKHWTAAVSGPELRFVLDLPAEWAPGVTLGAVVYDAAGAAPPLEVQLQLPVAAAPRVSPLQLQVPATARPGEEIELRLRNRGAAPIDVVLALADESVRLQAPDLLAERNPQTEGWLGALSAWRGAARVDLADWPQASGWMASWEYLFGGDAREPEALERIEVTGSRVAASDLFVRRVAFTKPDPRVGVRGAQPAGALRSRFADTAYWRPSLALAAGAEETVRFRLPDNLTRWQVSAWTVQGDDGFYYDEAAVRAGLPLELRAEAPARLHIGDQARIATAVRNSSATAQSVTAQLQLDGAGVRAESHLSRPLAPAQELRLTAPAAPAAAGTLSLQAQAQAGAESDGLELALPVSGVDAQERVTVAGWLDAAPLQLQLPTLPPGARQAQLRLRAGRGADLFAGGWIAGLRDYPHRCWEQSLSRAIGAAAALRLPLLQGLWPQADAVLAEVLAQAPGFQERGLFLFFADPEGLSQNGDVLLTAYSVQALEFLAGWGHKVDAAVLVRAREALARHLESAQRANGKLSRHDWRELATVLAALAGDARFDGLTDAADQHWDELDNFARSRLLLAMQARPGRFAQLAQRHGQLREAAPLQGGRRLLRDAADRSAWLGSDLRDQCGVIDTLQRLEAQDPELPAWRRGLGDLYAGGGVNVDTQAAAQCLMAVAPLPQAAAAADGQIVVELDGWREPLALGAASAEPVWSRPLGAATRTLVLQTGAGNAELGYVAEVSYVRDQRESQAQAIGLSLQRSYAIWRDGQWQGVKEGRIRAGDWVRVGLHLRTTALRHHVALVDPVPGGLRPEQFELDRIGGVALRNSGRGSWVFDTRRQSDTDVRFYASALPPGEHVAYYYARAAHHGDYFAPPATAELMYGGASVARTAPQRVKIGD